MKALFWIVAGLALAVGLTLAARSNDGLAILVVPPYRLTFSLNFFVLLLLALFLLLHGLLRLVHHMLALPRQARAFKAARRAAQARADFQAALVAFLEGRFASAEKHAEDAAAQGENPALAHLLAARAALAQHAPERGARHLAALPQDGEHTLARLVERGALTPEEAEALRAGARTPPHGSS